MKRFIGILLALSLALNLVAAVAPTGTADKVVAEDMGIPYKNPGNFTEMTVGDIDSLDPAWGYDTASCEQVGYIYETLLYYAGEETDQFVPVLATDWSFNSTDLTYRFRIREGVEFHNGNDLTPEDVEYSFERAMVQDRPGGPIWMFFQALLGVWSSDEVTFADIDQAVEVDGDYVVFTLDGVWWELPFLQMLYGPWASIVDKEWCIAEGDWDGTEGTWLDYNHPQDRSDTALFDKSNGTGPWKLNLWQPGNQIKLEKNTGYWRGYVPFDWVITQIVDDWETRKGALLNGDADLVYVFRGNIGELEGIEDLNVYQDLPQLSANAFFFNFDIASDSEYIGSGALDGNGIPTDFFADVDVRQGFNYAFDWERYIDDAWMGEAEQRGSPIIEGLPFYNPDASMYSLNLTKAAQHLQAAWGGGVWANGFNFTLVYNPGNLVRQTACQILAENLYAINPQFQVNVQPLEGIGYVPTIVSRVLPMFVIGWLADYPHPDNFAVPFMASYGAFAQAQGYGHPEIDQLIQDALHEPDLELQEDLYYQIQERYYEDAPSIMLCQPLGRRYFTKYIHGFYFNPMIPGQPGPLYYMSKFAEGMAIPYKNPGNFTEMTVGDIDSLDPAWGYDTASCEQVGYIYETLLYYAGEETDQFVPVLATEWTFNSTDLTYRFRIREGVEFHNGNDLTPEDVEYSFERAMVQDRPNGPIWMFLASLLGVYSSDEVTFADIDQAVEVDGDYVVFTLDGAWWELPFLQILCAPWASIVDKEWCIAEGDWDGTEGTWLDYNHPQDRSDTALFNKSNGTGPWKLNVWEPGQIKLEKNSSYWRGYVPFDWVITQVVDDWETRKGALLNGDADLIYVFRDNIAELEGIEDLNAYQDLHELSVDAFFFDFDIASESEYIGSGALDGNGIPTDFFTDIDVRKGFNYAFDWERYIDDALMGEAEQRGSPIIEGLPFYNPDASMYSLNLTKAAQHLQAAWGGDVWANGFNFTLLYNPGNLMRQTACEILAENLYAINPQFQVSVQPMEGGLWPNLLSGRLPMFQIGWIADYPHPDNLAVPFMASYGVFAQWQGYGYPELDQLIEDAFHELDPEVQETLYYQIQERYYEDAPSIMLSQPLGRRYFTKYIHGFYFNPVNPGQSGPLYHMNKSFGNTYALATSSTAGGSLTTPGDGTFTYEEGTVVDLVAAPDTGYQFDEWTGDVATIANVNAAATNITMNGNYSITANFCDPDYDNDGLLNTEESIGWEITIYNCDGSSFNTSSTTSDPFLADEDGDGLNDYEEKQGWHVEYTYQASPGPPPVWQWVEYDVTSNPHQADVDGDGKDDKEERAAGTDPNRADTDCDSNWNANDGFEIDYGLNPVDADTDNDGLADGEEIDIWIEAAGYDPDYPHLVPAAVLSEATANTNDPDTDDDGMTDGVEIAYWQGLGIPLVDAARYSADPDVDDDGVMDGEDACPTIFGKAEYQGCPVGNHNLVELHVIDRAKVCCGGAGSCKVPIEGAEIRVFDRNDPDFQALFNQNPKGPEYPNVFETDVGRVGTCVTNNIGECIAGEETIGDYLVIVKYMDDETGKTIYTGKPVSPEDFLDTDSDGIGDLASKDFQVIKVIDKDGSVDLKAGSKTVITGSFLEVIHPQYVIWDTSPTLYPFIFVSDSDWTVDVCVYVPEGYEVVEGECTQVFVANEAKDVIFTLQEIGSPEPDVQVSLLTTHKGKVKKTDLAIDGKRSEKYMKEEAKEKEKKDKKLGEMFTALPSPWLDFWLP